MGVNHNCPLFRKNMAIWTCVCLLYFESDSMFCVIIEVHRSQYRNLSPDGYKKASNNIALHPKSRDNFQFFNSLSRKQRILTSWYGTNIYNIEEFRKGVKAPKSVTCKKIEKGDNCNRTGLFGNRIEMRMFIIVPRHHTKNASCALSYISAFLFPSLRWYICYSNLTSFFDYLDNTVLKFPIYVSFRTCVLPIKLVASFLI